MPASQPVGTAEREPWRAWVVVILLFFFQFINYADKSVLGFAAPGIIHDLSLTKTQFGDVSSSFFFLFAISSIIFGFTANRMASRWLLLGMGLVWAVTQFPMAGTVGVGTLVTCRVLLGAAEGPGYPVAVHATYKWFANARRTLPTSLLVLGAGIGTAVAGQVLPLVIQHWNWHAAFLTVGLAGVVWSIAWFLFGREGPVVDEPPAVAASGSGGPSQPPVGLFKGISSDIAACWPVLATRTAVGVFLVSFAAYWSIAVGLSWGFLYMTEAVGLTQVQSGQIITLPTLLSLVLAPMIALASQRLIQRGVSSRYSRGAFGCVGVVLGAAGFAGMALTTKTVLSVGGFPVYAPVVFFTFAASITYVIYTIGPPIIAEISPPRQRASMLSIYNAFYSTAGIVAPSIMGRVLDATPGDPTTGYRNGYLLLALLLAVSGVVGLLLIDPARDAARLASKRAQSRAEVPSFSPAE